MRPTHALTALATTAVLAIIPATAGAAPVFFDHPKGGLSAPTDIHSTVGCIDRDAFVWPMQNPDGARSVFVEVSQYDHCADQVLLDHVGSSNALTAGELAMTRDLTTASLTATIPMGDALVDGLPATDPVTVDLSWTGSGRLHRELVRYESSHSDGVTVVNHDHEACRDATVSGTLASASIDYADGGADARLCRQIGGSLFLFIE
jgi:hypothetical protein